MDDVDRWRVCKDCLGIGDVKWWGGPACWCCGQATVRKSCKPQITQGGMVVSRPLTLQGSPARDANLTPVA